MNPIHSQHYCFHFAREAPLRAQGFLARELAICEPICWNQAGKTWFVNPQIKWESLEEDTIVQTRIEEWALARLLFLAQETNPACEISSLVAIEEKGLRIPFEVRDLHGVSVAELTLTLTDLVLEWRAIVSTYPIGREVADELEDRMLVDPSKLAKYEILVLGRRRFGWNGAKFLGQKTVRRPDYYARDRILERKLIQTAEKAKPLSLPSFTIEEYPVKNDESGESASRRPFRYTDAWPPILSWKEFPNWSHALDEEGRSGQDETTLKPSNCQKYVNQEVDYTAGDVWLAGGQSIPAMIRLCEGLPRGVCCFGEKSLWTILCLWDGASGSQLTPEQRSRFPLRVISRLSRHPRGPQDPFRLIIQENGQVSWL